MNQPIVVIDVPEGTAPDEAAGLLNAPGESYFLVQVLPIAGGHRGYLRRYKPTPTKAEAAKDNAGKVDDATALSILRANRNESIRTIVSLLDKEGIKRGRQWVCNQLNATCAEDGREDEALAFIKRCAHPDNTAEGVRVELRKRHGIERGVAWVREKLAAVRADKS